MTTNMAMTTNMKLNRDVPFPGGSVYFNAETGSITFPLLRIENQADGPVEISWPSAVSGKPQVVSIAPGRTTHLSIELNSGGVIRVRHTKTGGSGKTKITSLDRLVDDVDAQLGGQLYCNQTTQAVTLNCAWRTLEAVRFKYPGRRRQDKIKLKLFRLDWRRHFRSTSSRLLLSTINRSTMEISAN
jgi:hypothetical protein